MSANIEQIKAMLKKAVEGEACIPGGAAYAKEKSNSALKQHILDNFNDGDKVDSEKEAEKAAYKYSLDSRQSIYGRGDVIDAFEAGWKACKEQMLKDAVEGVAEELYNDGESQCAVGVGTYFKPGEEVYVIKKEDEK